jgi:hypothetical protein
MNVEDKDQLIWSFEDKDQQGYIEDVEPQGLRRNCYQGFQD